MGRSEGRPPASSGSPLPEHQVRGRWISATSAERDLGLLRRGELARLRELGTVHQAEAGTVVASAGSRVTHVQVVSDGELELRVRLDQGRAAMAVVRTGGVIADIPLLLNAPMPFDAIASRDTECIRLSRQLWTRLLTASPDLALRWMTSIARRLDDDRRRLVVVTSKPLVAQVAYLLLDLAEHGPADQPVVKLSHTTIAHLLGARRQSVTRVFADLKRGRLVETRYGYTVLLDQPGLQEVMGSEPLP
ncbi:MAG TPA: Crp/Fnr family transcriptional regulator [Mycobacteriales bacterium]|nr:Crp/Fnr family transcriptional regulator [Mycobacteriales bacterium]